MVNTVTITRLWKGNYGKHYIGEKSVFISYCHKDISEEWIDKLATVLGQYGIICIADIYDLQLGQDLPYFMEQIKKVDKVLILLGKEYKEKADGRTGGVGTETQIISSDVYKDVEQTKFIPVVVNKDSNGDAYLPCYLEGRLYTDFSNDDLFGSNIDELVRQIHKLPKRIKPTVMEPPLSLIQHRPGLNSLLAKDNLQFEELENYVLTEMENFKCSNTEYEGEKDEIIIKKIEESKEVRDFFIKNLARMIDNKMVMPDDIISFLEKAYTLSFNYKSNPYYEPQNDACFFFLHETVIYIMAILYKKKKLHEMYQMINTTYFPVTGRLHEKGGIHIDSFYIYLQSLEYRTSKLKLYRKILHAELLMQRAAINGVNIDFSDIRLSDLLISVLSEWYFKKTDNYIHWFPVTIVYSSRYNDDIMQLKKYLVSNSRFAVIKELFGVKNQAEFINRYKEMSVLLQDENRRVDYYVVPSICSIVSLEELFSME